MPITPFGMFFIPLAIWVFLLRPRYLVALTVFASVFAAASVLDFSLGDFVFGVPPYYFAAALLALRAVPALLRRDKTPRTLDSAMAGIAGVTSKFWIWATLSALILPFLFRGIGIIDPRSGDGDVALEFALHGETSPLTLGFRNLGQAAYLALNCIALLYVFQGCRRNERAPLAHGALRVAIAAVALFAMMEGVFVLFDWEFPYSLINSNPGYSQGFSAAIEGVPRVNATFAEASYAGGFLAAGVLGLLAARLYGGQAGLLAILFPAIALVLTTSSTGYATLLLGGAILLIVLMRDRLKSLASHRLLRNCASAALTLALAGVALLCASPALAEATVEMTLGKFDSMSFVARSSVDIYATRLLVDTYGLGTGLGSNRPSSFLAYLLSNVGIVGFMLFTLLIVRLFRELSRRSREFKGARFAMSLWLLAGLLLAMSVGIPDLNWPPLWGGLLVAGSLLTSRGIPVPRAAAPRNR